MSIMDSHPHPSLGRGNAAGSTLFDHEVSANSVIVNAPTASTNIENANQSPSTSHSQHHLHHHHHPPPHPHPNHPHHQFVDSSSVYHHHPFRTITPNSADSTNKILDPQPQSKSSTPTNQPQTQSRPNSATPDGKSDTPLLFPGTTSDWSATGLVPSPAPLPPSNRRPFSSSANIEGSAPRELSSASSGAGAGYPSPTATSSRRSSSNPNPNPSPNPAELLPSAQTPTTSASAPSYYQQHSGQDQASLAMIAAIDCSGLDVRPIYGTEDSRNGSVSNPSQPHSDNHSQTHTRVSNSEEVRASYYAPPPSAHYSSIGSGILPSHYPHIPSPIAPQPVPRRTSNSTSSGTTYGPYSSLTGPVPLTSNAYAHHPSHHPEGPVVSGWTPSVDSVRDSVSPYNRPHRQPSGPLAPHHAASSTPFAHSIRNGQLLAPHHHPSNSTAQHQHHQPGTIQYNAQGRPLSYICTTCLRAFDRPSALQIHERSHTGERPFPCPWNGCVKRFTTHGNMVKHSRVCPFREPED